MGIWRWNAPALSAEKIYKFTWEATDKVGIDASKNAALLAIQILALTELGLDDKLKEYREKGASSQQDA